MATIAEVQPAPLSEADAEDLKNLEATIERGMVGFLDVAESLVAIRDRGLYRASYPTFDAYLRSRWTGISRSYAYRLLAARSVVRELSADSGEETVLPANPEQTRPLQNDALSPTQRREAWSDAVREAGGQPTSRQVAEAVNRIVGGEASQVYTVDLPKPSPVGVDAVLEDEVDLAEAKAALAEGEFVQWEDLKAEMGLNDDPEAEAERRAIQAVEADVEPEVSEEDQFVAQCTLAEQLSGRCRQIFEQDARRWFRAFQKYLEPMKREGFSKEITGAWEYECSRFLRLGGPTSWVRCIANGCKEGFSGGQKCVNCRGRGYILR